MSSKLQPVLTKRAIQKIVGSGFVVNDPNAQGNFKLDLTKLTRGGDPRGYTDEQKIDDLSAAKLLLREAGYNVDVRLNQPRSQGGSTLYTPWPHLWVNKAPRVTQSDANNAMQQRLLDQNEALIKLLAKMQNVDPRELGLEPVETSEVEADSSETTESDDEPFESEGDSDDLPA